MLKSSSEPKSQESNAHGIVAATDLSTPINRQIPKQQTSAQAQHDLKIHNNANHTHNDPLYKSISRVKRDLESAEKNYRDKLQEEKRTLAKPPTKPELHALNATFKTKIRGIWDNYCIIDDDWTFAIAQDIIKACKGITAIG